MRCISFSAKLISFLLFIVSLAGTSTHASWRMEAFKELGLHKHTLRPFSASLSMPRLHPTSWRTEREFRFPNAFSRQYTTGSPSHFFDPKNDIAFKKLFATQEHKPLLMSFLNSLLRLEGVRTIKNVELLPTEQIPHIKTAKRSILDVKCTDQRNFQYIVEMQNRKVPNFIKRSQYYVANLYSSQLGNATNYLELRPVILLTIANHDLFPNKTSYISYHKTLDTETQEHDLQDMSYAFIELPKFKKHEEHLKTAEDHWLYLFKHSNKLIEMPKSIPAEIQEAYTTLEQYHWTPEEKEAYDKANMALIDEFDALRAEREQGLTQGVIQGRQEAAENIAKRLLTQGIDAKIIASSTGLSAEQIAALKSEKKV